MGGALIIAAVADGDKPLAAAAGGSVCKTKFSIGPSGFIALVTDTGGNMIWRHSLK